MRPGRCGQEKMLEAAVWIGIALCGLAVLGIFEYVRTRAVIKANSKAIKEALPIVAFGLLGFIAGSVATLFFFLFFLVDFWQYALVIGGVIFVLLFRRIRRNWSQFMAASGPDPVERMNATTPGLFPQISVLALQAVGAITVLFMMVPVLTGGFLLYMFVSDVAGAVVANLILAMCVVFLTGYLYTRLRTPPQT